MQTLPFHLTFAPIKPHLVKQASRPSFVQRMKSLPKRRKRILLLYGIAGLFLLGIVCVNQAIQWNAKGKLFSSVAQCPKVAVALVPGTSKHLASGKDNWYYNYRIAAAVSLYRADKIRYLIVSGDSSSTTYDEPKMMKADLTARGIPSDRIYCDYAGFDTWDSMERALKLFGQRKLLIVSQQFHNERAIYIGESMGMTVYGFNAKDVESYGGFKTQVREKLARVKVFWNLVFGHRANLSGKKVSIGTHAS